ncbi:MAG: molybdopterin-guanine dinucleotide biosynthesis protein B [Sulfuricella sp.]|nr:molybdopterin-guanine dinucleotide biosynthesis protein B [Sulfuricella sp.]
MKIFGFAGYSGAGKTTLIEKLVPLFTARGLTVSLIKQTHHDFDVDQPGKDSWRHRQAGCQEVLVASNRRWALMHELRGAPEPALEDHLARLAPCDLTLVEGYKQEAIPKLEVHRAANGKPYLFPNDAHIVALAGDAPGDSGLPCYALDATEEIAHFILRHTGLNS